MHGILKVLFLASLIFAVGCTKESGSDDSSQTIVPESAEVVSDTDSVLCGVFTEDKFQSVVPYEKAEPVRVRAVSADLVTITRTSGEQSGNSQLVKLEGITSSGISAAKISRAVNFINQATSFGATFLAAGPSCAVTFDNGGEGIYGQIITNDGRSLSELLVFKGLALPESGICGGNELAGCYAGIEVEEEFSNAIIDHVLWKPVADSDGKLVILTNAFGINVSVEGATSSMAGRNSGPSNGYGSTIRYPYPGCAYGSPRLRFFDSQDRTVRLANGETSLVIRDGCSRTDLRF